MFATLLLPGRGCLTTVRQGTLMDQKLMMGVGSSMVPPLGVRAVLIAQAGATEGSPMLLNDALTSISIILSKGDGPSVGLERVLLLSCLTGFSGLVLLELAPPFKVTELPAQAL